MLVLWDFQNPFIAGKSTLCGTLQETIKDLKIINIGQFAKENNCLGEWDEKYESYEIDEDKIIDELEEIISGGNVVIEHHVTDLFPERDVLSLNQNNLRKNLTIIFCKQLDFMSLKHSFDDVTDGDCATQTGNNAPARPRGSIITIGNIIETMILKLFGFFYFV